MGQLNNFEILRVVSTLVITVIKIQSFGVSVFARLG